MENKQSNQIVKQGHKYMKRVKTEAYYVKEAKKREQKTWIGVSRQEYVCARISLHM